MVTDRAPWFAGLRGWRLRRGFPVPWLPLPWRWRLWYVKRQYDVGVSLAERLCKGNRYGAHTPSWPAYQPMGGRCFCSRVRGRLDYIPF
jgi:hypothetical protein